MKLIIDFAMTVALMLLMAYELIGQVSHEWIGIGMFVLFILHHILNWKWSKGLLKGKYTAFRIFQTVLVFFVLLTMVGSMVSGIILSSHALTFLPISRGRNFARILHMLSAYWGFVLMSLHLGFHWSMMMAMAKRLSKKDSSILTWGLRSIAVMIAGYGVYAFFHREIGLYMLLKSKFVFFDFEEPLILFFMDYIAIMGLFVFIGHYLSVGLKKQKATKSMKSQ